MSQKQPFFQRFYIYQNERFPFLSNGLFLTAFTFSAISYSRICRGAAGFVDVKYFISAAVTTISFFFLLRIVDEFKDADYDAEYRQHLPVPRKLISFKELRWMGVIALIIQLGINLILTPEMLKWLVIPLLFLLLIAKDFFVSEWLNRNWAIFVGVHMLFFPAIDYYTSGMDWYMEGPGQPAFGMIFFFALSYANGLVWEIGRKLKTSENEEHNSYSRRYGRKKATWFWIAAISIAYLFAILAAVYAGFGWLGVSLLSLIYLSSLSYGILFLFRQSIRLSKLIEVAAGAWGLFMYLTIGALPMILKLLGKL